MKEIDVNELINMNYRVLTLLGIAMSIIDKSCSNKADKDWFSKAIEEVIYKNQPIPLRDLPK